MNVIDRSRLATTRDGFDFPEADRDGALAPATDAVSPDHPLDGIWDALAERQGSPAPAALGVLPDGVESPTDIGGWHAFYLTPSDPGDGVDFAGTLSQLAAADGVDPEIDLLWAAGAGAAGDSVVESAFFAPDLVAGDEILPADPLDDWARLMDLTGDDADGVDWIGLAVDAGGTDWSGLDGVEDGAFAPGDGTGFLA
jgi:hypothetical protein